MSKYHSRKVKNIVFDSQCELKLLEKKGVAYINNCFLRW